MTAPAPLDLRTDTRTEPVGLDEPHPELAWRLPAGSTSGQVAWQVQVTTGGFSRGRPAGEVVWDSGKVEDERPYGHAYAGAALTSSRTYSWRVRVWTAGQKRPSPWSEPSTFETGVLDPALRTARWMSGPAPASSSDYRALYLRSTVELAGEVVRARAYVSALGWYRFFVNGTDLTGPALVPRWTPFDSYVEYQAYDVTAALRAGSNVLAMAVGDGRFRGRNGVDSRRAVYGDRLAGWCQLEVELADGSTRTVVSDSSWLAGDGRILASDPKYGERVDLRVPDADWLTAVEPPTRFAPAHVLPRHHRRLVAEETGRVQQVGTLPAVSVARTPSGRQVVDLGQNFAGVVRIRLDGPAGTTVRLRHSELLTPAGELDVDYIHNLGARSRWDQRDLVTLDGEETWFQPWFTIHGFRYLEVDGLERDLEPTDVEGVVLSSDLPVAGGFTCSDQRLEQLHHNVEWSLRSNFVDTPTDCPTRERSGWTGDIQVFGPTATMFVDAQAYLRRYLRNLAAEQLPDGTIPPFVPAEASAFSGGLSVLAKVTRTSVGWGDVSVLLPWTLYTHYGDTAVLERAYPSMTAWIDQLARRARGKQSLQRRLRGTHRREVERLIVDTGYHWGEWLRPGESFQGSIGDSLFRSRAIIATAYLAHSARRLSVIAGLLGREGDARRYGALADEVRAAWRTAFLHADGSVGRNRQEDYVRAIAFDLLDPEEKPAAVDRLVGLVEAAGDHLDTGFLATPLLLTVLVDGGRADVAYRLLLQTTNPSWLHQVERGATTIWETWEGYKPDGHGAASHNHYAFGTVAGFLTRYVAGLSPAEPGYRLIDVRPTIGGGLTHASGWVQTPYGRASSAWRLEGDQVVLDVEVPPGATARVQTGDGTVHETGAGTHRLTWPAT